MHIRKVNYFFNKDSQPSHWSTKRRIHENTSIDIFLRSQYRRNCTFWDCVYSFCVTVVISLQFLGDKIIIFWWKKSWFILRGYHWQARRSAHSFYFRPIWILDNNGIILIIYCSFLHCVNPNSQLKNDFIKKNWYTFSIGPCTAKKFQSKFLYIWLSTKVHT